jgi:hypothetical protein
MTRQRVAVTLTCSPTFHQFKMPIPAPGCSPSSLLDHRMSLGEIREPVDV